MITDQTTKDYVSSKIYLVNNKIKIFDLLVWVIDLITMTKVDKDKGYNNINNQ